ncbi:unnamed protein product [Sphenostylis stenocarpa]|uniref:Uncharacterized protein n=1 Tax=Sphenostylis stenocarpa TaxID=92480 RepID=A0AA86SCV9_9FABA|nr:unnamed protein product [Sphenostylis stenocarpa]
MTSTLLFKALTFNSFYTEPAPLGLGIVVPHVGRASHLSQDSWDGRPNSGTVVVAAVPFDVRGTSRNVYASSREKMV